MGLYTAQPGGRRWRRFLSELPHGEEGLAALTEHIGFMAASRSSPAYRGQVAAPTDETSRPL